MYTNFEIMRKNSKKTSNKTQNKTAKELYNVAAKNPRISDKIVQGSLLRVAKKLTGFVAELTFILKKQM